MKFDTKFFDDLGVTLSKTAKDIGGRAESFYGKQKLRGQMMLEERALEKALAELGRVVYKRYAEGEQVDDDLRVFCENVDLYFEKLEKMKNEAAGKSGKKFCPSCGKEMDEDAAFCGSCGAPFPVEEVPVEEAPAEEVPTEETPVEEVPAEEASVEEAPAEEAPAEETLAEETPAEDVAEEVAEAMDEVAEAMDEVAEAMEEVREAMEEIAEEKADDAE